MNKTFLFSVPNFAKFQTSISLNQSLSYDLQHLILIRQVVRVSDAYLLKMKFNGDWISVFESPIIQQII